MCVHIEKLLLELSCLYFAKKYLYETIFILNFFIVCFVDKLSCAYLLYDRKLVSLHRFWSPQIGRRYAVHGNSDKERLLAGPQTGGQLGSHPKNFSKNF